jgi:hypothetical protein
MPEVATPNQAEREFETASDEFFKHRSQVNAATADPWFANVKRTYDEYQQESLESIKRNRTIVSFRQACTGCKISAGERQG